MTARDELAVIVDDADLQWQSDKGCTTTQEWSQDIADAILAAGYRKPRTITDPEELDSLEVRATILDGNGHVWTNDGDCSDQWGSVTTTESYGGPQWVTSFDITLPATVLYEGAQS